ncbi:hypothetical protein SBOR_3104 [Sclerotinia borealis F-4128]|uniref:2EXR domain-containing protein n=1 Tax=Sclerotinia borealis (strain F-4128) TaxID=1432307 RepID=W9CIA2_SCLBF|nr:hypothetical protein SBOR_3104 [Sclerotinia borealis F-4128]
MDPSNVSVLSSFEKFPLLPKEIQLQIWYHALPKGQLVSDRAIELSSLRIPHVLYYVCLESRQAYLKFYKQIYNHDANCHNYKRLQGLPPQLPPQLFNPMIDTILWDVPFYADFRYKYLLLKGYNCPHRCTREITVEYRHIAILADQKWYSDAATAYNVNSRVKDVSSNTGKRISIWEQFLKMYPALETLSFVVGCEIVEQTLEMFPKMRLVKSLKGSGRKNQAGLKLLMENNFAPRIAEIRSSFEEWKRRHPEANIPKIEMVFPADDTASS